MSEERTLHDMAEDAAGRLPRGWTVKLAIERHGSWVELDDPDGNAVEFPTNRETIEEEFEDAVGHAIHADAKWTADPSRPVLPCPDYRRLAFDFAVSESSPVVRGTWVTTSQIVSHVVDGYTWDDILRCHPEITQDDIRAAMSYELDQQVKPAPAPAPEAAR